MAITEIINKQKIQSTDLINKLLVLIQKVTIMVRNNAI